MSNDSNTSTLYLESTASGGANAQTHSRSGQTSQALPFTSVGTTGGHLSIAGSLPVPFTDAHITDPDQVEVAIALPAVGGNWYGGTNLALTLPMVKASVAGRILGSVRVATTLPKVAASVDMLCGALMEVAATLPVPVATLNNGWTFSGLQLPAVRAVLHLTTTAVLEIAGRLPAVRAALAIGAPNAVLSMALILPAAVGAAGRPAVGMILPAVRGSLVITSGTVAERITWVMNIENNAVTEFDDFEFKQYARAFNRYWATGMDGGLFELGGDRDLTAPIVWSFETGISDLGTRGLKGVLGAYLDGIFERHIEFTVVADRGRYVYNHTVRGDPENHLTQRVSLGRGIRTGNIGFGLASKKGAYFEMDSITPEYVVSNRNLG